MACVHGYQLGTPEWLPLSLIFLKPGVGMGLVAERTALCWLVCTSWQKALGAGNPLQAASNLHLPPFQVNWPDGVVVGL